MLKRQQKTITVTPVVVGRATAMESGLPLTYLLGIMYFLIGIHVCYKEVISPN